jgi:hypothetical protein
MAPFTVNGPNIEKNVSSKVEKKLRVLTTSMPKHNIKKDVEST